MFRTRYLLESEKIKSFKFFHNFSNHKKVEDSLLIQKNYKKKSMPIEIDGSNRSAVDEGDIFLTRLLPPINIVKRCFF